MTTDSELLRQFAKTNSQDAFAELVKRHVNLVYSAARRQVNGDEHLAKDISQTVFTDLARKANSLSRRESLTGWLYTSAHFAAVKIMRGENRRRDREEKFMREPTSETAPEADWEKLRPTLDDAMHELKATDRNAILLRYFENQPFVQVGAKLGLNENAARMRVERALEKLRAIFAKRGIATASAIASTISANAVQLAPANLAATLTTTSIAAAGTGTFTLLKIMTATKLKLAFSAIVVASAATAIVVQHQTQNKLRGENESLQQRIAQLQTDNENFSNQLAEIGDAKKLPDEQFDELLKLRGEVGVLRRQVGELGKLQKENKEIRKQLSDLAQSVQKITAVASFNKTRIETINAAKHIELAMRMYSNDNGNQFPINLDLIQNYLSSDTSYTNSAGNVGIDSFELVNVGQASERYPQMLVLRERLPRQVPDGSWERDYVLADGSVQVQKSINGNFYDWEKEQQQYNPPPNQ